MLRIRLIIFLTLFTSTLLQAQDEENVPVFNPNPKPVHSEDVLTLSPIQRYEDSLVHALDSMYLSAIPEVTEGANMEVVRLLKRMFRETQAFRYEFPKLKEYMNIIDPPDKKFRLYNWEVQRNEGVARYYLVVQKPDGSILPMLDVSDQILRGAEDSVFNTSGMRWYGCLYYNLIPREVNGNTIYFLIGRNINTLNSDRKIVEALQFTEDGQALFGQPVFNTIDRGVRKYPKRFIYEYQKNAVLSLNYDKETDQIIFDHCESQIGDAAKRYTYTPDGTYDGMRWNNNQWVMYENIVDIQILEDGKAPVDQPLK
jgi:hypothetical protein